MPCDNRSQNNVDDTYLEFVNDIDIMRNQYNPDMIILVVILIQMLIE